MDNSLSNKAEESCHKHDYLLTQLSEEIKQLNEMLLSVSWKEADLSSCIIENCGQLMCEKLSDRQNELIRTVINFIPEWKRLIGCKQHKMHDYCLDFHTLSVLKNIQINPDFENLKNYDKLIILYSALLHDIEKNQNEVDVEHPLKGAEKSSTILYKLGFGEDFISSVYLLIKYHQILGLIASERINLPEDELVEIFKNPGIVDLQVILSVADIKSVKKDGSFYRDGWNEKFEKIKEEIKYLIQKKT